MDSYEAFMVFFIGIFGIFALIALATTILIIVSKWKILEKGNKPGWGSLIPFYNQYLLCEMTGVNPWWVLIYVGIIVGGFAFSLIFIRVPYMSILFTLAIQVANIYYQILLNVSLAKSLKKEPEFAILLILVPIIGYPILAFSKKTEYIGKNPMKDIIFDNMK